MLNGYSSYTGPKNRGTVLWLPGWGMPESVFDGLRALLPEFRHAAADFSRAESPEAVFAAAAGAAAKARAAKPEEPPGPLLIAAWSMGGLPALRLAAAGMADGLLLLACTGRFTRPRAERDKGWPDPVIRQMQRSLESDRAAVESQFREAMFTEEEWAAGCQNHLPPMDGPGAWDTSALLAGLQLLRDENALPLLPAVRCPSLIMHGTLDRICPYGAAEELAALLPGTRLLPLEGAGHVPFLLKEAEAAEALRGWWDERQTEPHPQTV
ncbi:alpha/beta hydrolase [Paenibacillus sambharensis]|uniref:Alpha/beta hydrolase n=1 Tax=Paenibacillus sambharensis TaxID=1803190 RepID=A0A2W1LE38_9BACL|nr:alpha/beta fold hydrolase [Paenibacillus sambharensis]PZD96340.1 alpha/beta hydrolase [Paenibacillus sambharensis]